MLSDVHLGKGAGVSHPDHLHSEIPEEINDLQRLPPQTKDQNDGSHHWTYQLLKNKHLEENMWGKRLKLYTVQTSE